MCGPIGGGRQKRGDASRTIAAPRLIMSNPMASRRRSNNEMDVLESVSELNPLKHALFAVSAYNVYLCICNNCIARALVAEYQRTVVALSHSGPIRFCRLPLALVAGRCRSLPTPSAWGFHWSFGCRTPTPLLTGPPILYSICIVHSIRIDHRAFTLVMP